MKIFGLFSETAIDAGLEEYHKTQGAILLDVRTSEEFADGHIPNSRNLPLLELARIEEEISEKDAPIFVYCHSGSRSKQAAAALKQMGYCNIKNIGGIIHYHGKVEK
ncbi:MAG: rhodanese-like domain-containing protein [Clostridiales bacterium]|jgi:phage shock protein E|nr:rhodanese-like domain-containing protein [Clostridiales bacterium]